MFFGLLGLALHAFVCPPSSILAALIESPCESDGNGNESHVAHISSHEDFMAAILAGQPMIINIYAPEFIAADRRAWYQALAQQLSCHARCFSLDVENLERPVNFLHAACAQFGQQAADTGHNLKGQSLLKRFVTAIANAHARAFEQVPSQLVMFHGGNLLMPQAIELLEPCDALKALKESGFFANAKPVEPVSFTSENRKLPTSLDEAIEHYGAQLQDSFFSSSAQSPLRKSCFALRSRSNRSGFLRRRIGDDANDNSAR